MYKVQKHVTFAVVRDESNGSCTPPLITADSEEYAESIASLLNSEASRQTLPYEPLGEDEQDLVGGAFASTRPTSLPNGSTGEQDNVDPIA